MVIGCCFDGRFVILFCCERVAKNSLSDCVVITPRESAIQYLKYLGLKFTLQICAWMPLRGVHVFARIIGYCLYLFPTKMKQVTQINLCNCFPEMEEAERDMLLKESLCNTAATALEMGKTWFLPMEKTLNMVVDVEGRNYLDEALAEGKGVILLAPHLGNWEILGFYATEVFATTLTCLYQPPKAKQLDSMLRKARTRSTMKIAPTNRKGVATLLAALQNSEMIGILPDQVPGREGGVVAPFFGMPALSMTLISKLVARTNARVVCGFAKRLSGSRGYQVNFKPADNLIYNSNMKKSVEGLNSSVEQCVRELPSQYQWEYKRFKHLLEGEKKLY
jgi:KDO2-lipid IV(A) lauroyltransferase